jgi:hypothetical protein
LQQVVPKCQARCSQRSRCVTSVAAAAGGADGAGPRTRTLSCGVGLRLGLL